MRPFLMMVLDKRSYRSPQAPCAEWRNACQPLGRDGADTAFGKASEFRFRAGSDKGVTLPRHAGFPFTTRTHDRHPVGLGFLARDCNFSAS
jgi:hypothetical protein